MRMRELVPKHRRILKLFKCTVAVAKHSDAQRSRKGAKVFSSFVSIDACAVSDLDSTIAQFSRLRLMSASSIVRIYVKQKRGKHGRRVRRIKSASLTSQLLFARRSFEAFRKEKAESTKFQTKTQIKSCNRSTRISLRT